MKSPERTPTPAISSLQSPAEQMTALIGRLSVAVTEGQWNVVLDLHHNVYVFGLVYDGAQVGSAINALAGVIPAAMRVEGWGLVGNLSREVRALGLVHGGAHVGAAITALTKVIAEAQAEGQTYLVNNLVPYVVELVKAYPEKAQKAFQNSTIGLTIVAPADRAKQRYPISLMTGNGAPQAGDGAGAEDDAPQRGDVFCVMGCQIKRSLVEIFDNYVRGKNSARWYDFVDAVAAFNAVAGEVSAVAQALALARAEAEELARSGYGSLATVFARADARIPADVVALVNNSGRVIRMGTHRAGDPFHGADAPRANTPAPAVARG